MKDVADVAVEWFYALSGVVHQWFQYQEGHAPAEKLIEAIDELIRVHPAYKQARALDVAEPTTKQ